MALAKPVARQTYTLAQIMNELDLPDTPFLRFACKGETAVIQDGNGDPLTVPAMAESLWRYQYTTHESCPLFTYVGEVDIMTLVDVSVRHGDDHVDDPYEVYFKGMR
jgi:hypothetical protein